ncbi:hypothetical protein BDY21DRAFT_358764 [Lineolata rhizophorae]|uniref:Uncharacterized protein n=1 Tax=Lineolata rhizophorae TaxID=578093 RepID=A0A6A6NLN5_9PEZI|nr:hypothetical protein BDY21DRAFT_358764 [Lineolata rhizophorae]
MSGAGRANLEAKRPPATATVSDRFAGLGGSGWCVAAAWWRAGRICGWLAGWLVGERRGCWLSWTVDGTGDMWWWWSVGRLDYDFACELARLRAWVLSCPGVL